ncbi:MAG: alpha/beta hydrolase, partial [Fusobacteriaceae bacterium]|nr:alpha/beta hydrolase [Fusobacteriaceae bacterium]
VAEPGARGRTTQDANGKYTGKAPADIVDLKAAVRYLHFNDSVMPGDANKIISNGTSAGGALSALIGGSGNNTDYEPYLKEIGAANGKDDIFAVSAYCPITNLDHADMAYEWMFNGINNYKKLVMTGMIDFNVKRTLVEGTMTDSQIKLSKELSAMFPSYINSLGLKDEKGNILSMDSNGNGNFKNYIKSFIVASAQKALDNGTDLSTLTWITIKNKTVIDIDFDSYVKYVGRMKTTSAFDGVDLSTGENDLFGTANTKAQHFTTYGKANTTVNGSSADSLIVKMMNPLNYIGTKGTTVAKHWRIRHGAIDSDTSVAISAILSTTLKNKGFDVDYAVPWGVPHSGDYDLDELFAWMEKISK